MIDTINDKINFLTIITDYYLDEFTSFSQNEFFFFKSFSILTTDNFSSPIELELEDDDSFLDFYYANIEKEKFIDIKKIFKSYKSKNFIKYENFYKKEEYIAFLENKMESLKVENNNLNIKIFATYVNTEIYGNLKIENTNLNLEIESLKTEIKELKEEIYNLNLENANLRSEKFSLETPNSNTEIKELQEEIYNLNLKTINSKTEIKELQDEIYNFNIETIYLSTEINELKEQISELKIEKAELHSENFSLKKLNIGLEMDRGDYYLETINLKIKIENLLTKIKDLELKLKI